MNRRDFLTTSAAVGTAAMGRLIALPTLTEAGPQDPAGVPKPTPTAPLRLSSNENALGLAPTARQAVIAGLEEANRYPDAIRDELVHELADLHEVTPESLVLGNGSTEILQMIVQAASAPNAMLVIADPTFEAIAWYQRPFSFRVERVPLNAHHEHDIERMREITRTCGCPSVVYICNPNNPTATITPSKEVDAWIEEAPDTVLFAIDEAYFEYAQAPAYWSAVKWVQQRPNVVVTRTFSKIYAMAGMRLGYALAHPETAAKLNRFMSWDNANSPALIAALASLRDENLLKNSRAVNQKAQKIVTDCLDDLDLEYLPSQTNFLMHRITGDLASYRQHMRNQGIHVGRPFPPMLEYNRLSLGLPTEMERFAETLVTFRQKGWV